MTQVHEARLLPRTVTIFQYVSADLCKPALQPGISKHCETMDMGWCITRYACLHPQLSQGTHSSLITEGGSGWVGLGAWWNVPESVKHLVGGLIMQTDAGSCDVIKDSAGDTHPPRPPTNDFKSSCHSLSRGCSANWCYFVIKLLFAKNILHASHRLWHVTKHTVTYVTYFCFCLRCHFYRAMRCTSAVFAVMQCLSVRLSRSWITSKRINISSKFFHHRVATPF